MQRRRLLALAGAAVGGLSGCLAAAPAEREHEAESQASEAEPQSSETVSGVELPVSGATLDRRLPRDAIAAIDDPAFAADWSGLDPEGVEDPSLPGGAAVVGIERDGEARAYPMRILDRHEIVNDSLGNPIAVTYCPRCGSSVVFDRRVDGETTVFGVSGLLWREHLVMYDDSTESRWSQLLATAIQGPKTGTRLDILPSSLTTWGEWQRSHPETSVLLPPPQSGTVTDSGGYGTYFEQRYPYQAEDQLVGFDSDDGELRQWTLVVGIEHDGIARAYPFFEVAERGVVNDSVGSLPVVVSVAPGGTLVAYDRRVGGRRREFAADGERYLQAGGSRFERTTGRAVDGPHEGTRLARANKRPQMFWRGWSNTVQQTDVYGQ